MLTSLRRNSICEVYFLVQSCRNRPAEFARCPRCPPGACQRRLLPLSVLVMLIFRCFLVQVGNFMKYGVCKFVLLGSPLGHPKGVPCAELSPQVTEGLPATAANRFHKELRFFFSLLKRKKEAKKEKSSRFTCTTRSNITRRSYKRFPPTKLPRRGKQAAAAAVTLPFLQLKLGRKVSGDPPHAVTLPFSQLKLGRRVSGDPPHAAE